MNRRFLHLVINNVIGNPCTHSLHSINATSFFYTARQNRRTATMEDGLLPPPVMSFHRPCSPPDYYGSMDFMSLGRNKKDIVGVDHKGRTILYDTALHAVRTMPVMHARKYFPISITAGNSLYVMNSRLGPPEQHTFEALTYGPMPSSPFQDWFWHSLPLPPYVYDSGYDDDEPGYGYEVEQPYQITAYAVVADSNIWISTAGVGTYSFDTASRIWSKPGKWSLPLVGSLEYAPEHNLWFGFSSEENQFCSCNLSKGLPMLENMWELNLRPANNWIPMDSYIVPLGSGKFCIVKLFETLEEVVSGAGYKYDKNERFAVITGLEVEHENGIGLRMMEHKSKYYILENKKIVKVI